MIKNCYSCEHLEYMDLHNENDDGGYCCFKRQDAMTPTQESLFLTKIDTGSYRDKYKRCFVLKSEAEAEKE